MNSTSCFFLNALSSLKGYCNSDAYINVLLGKTMLMVPDIYGTAQLSRSGTLLLGPSI